MPKRKRDAGYEPGKTTMALGKHQGEEWNYNVRTRRRLRIVHLAKEAPDGLAVHWPTLTVSLRKP